MSTAYTILGACVTILLAIIGGWFELRKMRITQQTVAHEVTSPVPHSPDNEANNLREQIEGIKETVDKLDTKVDEQMVKLAQVQAIVGLYGRRSTDR